MVQAGFRDSSIAQRELRELFDRSDRLLAPIGDPLRADLGLHRWLRKDREEAYSDWFEWVLQHLESKDLVEIFRIQPDDVAQFCRENPFRTRREQIIPEGRLDIVIAFGRDVATHPTCTGDAVLVIEVKVTTADEAETDKQSGYREWLEALGCRYMPQPVLVAVGAEHEAYEGGFISVPWPAICVTLRRMLPRLHRRLGVLKTAMIAAFVGAVESNLLHLTMPDDPHRGRSLFVLSTIEHLKASME
jgi:hypothetical protein